MLHVPLDMTLLGVRHSWTDVALRCTLRTSVRILTLTLGVFVLASCLPVAPPAAALKPTVVSVSLPSAVGDPVVLQGRGFGDGAAGALDDSFLVVGARSDCSEGVTVTAASWSARRIDFDVPVNVGAGYVCVVVNGVESNAMPLDLD